MVHDLIDLDTPPRADHDRAAETKSSTEVEPPPGLTVPDLMNAIHRHVERKREGRTPSPPSSSSSERSSSSSSVRDRKKKNKGKKKKKHRRSPSSSSGSSPEIKAKSNTVKIISHKLKEPDSIKIKEFPEAHAFEAWKIHIRGKIDAASGGSDEAFEWIMEVEDSNVTYEDLGNKADFPSLDAKLSDAILMVAKGHIGKLLANMCTEEIGRAHV